MDLSPALQVGSVITLNIAGREEEWTILGSGGRGFIPVAYVFYDDLARRNRPGWTCESPGHPNDAHPILSFNPACNLNVLARLDADKF